MIAETRLEAQPDLCPDCDIDLGLRTQLICSTHLLILFYLSVKFHLICSSSFWPGLELPSRKAIVVVPKSIPAKIIDGKKRVKVRSAACHYATKKKKKQKKKKDPLKSQRVLVWTV